MATVVACVVTIMPAVVSQSIIIQSIDVFIFAILAMSLNLLVGYSGLVSMGHAAFFAIGGYSFGIIQHHVGLYNMSGIGLPVTLLGWFKSRPFLEGRILPMCHMITGGG